MFPGSAYARVLPRNCALAAEDFSPAYNKKQKKENKYEESLQKTIGAAVEPHDAIEPSCMRPF